MLKSLFSPFRLNPSDRQHSDSVETQIEIENEDLPIHTASLLDLLTPTLIDMALRAYSGKIQVETYLDKLITTLDTDPTVEKNPFNNPLLSNIVSYKEYLSLVKWVETHSIFSTKYCLLPNKKCRFG